MLDLEVSIAKNERGVAMCETIGRCGFKCHLCPVYTPNVKSEEDRVEISSKWKQFYDFEADPNSLRCDGCIQKKQADGQRLHSDCEFRKCAESQGLNFCKNCENYICSELKQYLNEYTEVAESLLDSISDEDYNRHLKPYLQIK